MTAKRFMIYRLIGAALIAGVVSASIVRGNYVLPLVTVVASAALLYAMKKRVKEVLEDERDYELAGKAARYALTIFTALAAFASIVLFAQRQADPVLGAVASVLAYSACGLMLVYSVLFKYFQNK